MTCGYMNGQRRLFGLHLLAKANEAGTCASIIWRLEVGKTIDDKEKTAITRLLTKPGLERKIRNEFGWIEFKDPQPSDIDPEKLFSGRYSPEKIEEAEKYLIKLGKFYLNASDNYV